MVCNGAGKAGLKGEKMIVIGGRVEWGGGSWWLMGGGCSEKGLNLPRRPRLRAKLGKSAFRPGKHSCFLGHLEAFFNP